MENSADIINTSWNTNKEDDCLQELQILIQENAVLQDFKEFLDERFLLHFVRGKKFDSKRAYETLETYIYVRRTKYNDFFKSLSPKTIHLNNGMLGVLKSRDHLNRLVVVDRARIWDPKKLSIEDAFKLFILVLEEIWHIEEAETNGVVVIFDMANWNLQHIKALSPFDVIKGFNLIASNFPLTYKAVHIVNENYFFSLVLKVVKPALPKKLRDRIHAHSTCLSSLHEQVYREVLPESLGGNVPDFEAFDKHFEQKILDKEEYYRRFAEKL